MPRQEFTGQQIRDGSVFREDLNITQTGKAVVRKILEGTGVTISYDGVIVTLQLELILGYLLIMLYHL